MNKKIFYFDVETTGIDPVLNDITQLSGMIEINGEIKETFNFRCQPINWANISPEALQVTGVSLEQLKTYPKPSELYAELIHLLSKYCNKFDKSDKFYFAGYNVRFDIDFLNHFFRKQGDGYFGSWFNWKAIDPLPLFHYLEWRGDIALENYKLQTVCDHFGIAIEAHDALSDISATRSVIKELNKLLNPILASEEVRNDVNRQSSLPF